MIRHITTYDLMPYKIFLVIVEKTGYVVHQDQDDGNGLCPCCMYPEHRQAIQKAVNDALDAGEIVGQARWVSNASRNGERLDGYDGLDQRFFRHGSLSEIPEEILSKLRNLR